MDDRELDQRLTNIQNGIDYLIRTINEEESEEEDNSGDGEEEELDETEKRMIEKGTLVKPTIKDKKTEIVEE